MNKIFRINEVTALKIGSMENDFSPDEPKSRHSILEKEATPIQIDQNGSESINSDSSIHICSHDDNKQDNKHVHVAKCNPALGPRLMRSTENFYQREKAIAKTEKLRLELERRVNDNQRYYGLGKPGSQNIESLMEEFQEGLK